MFILKRADGNRLFLCSPNSGRKEKNKGESCWWEIETFGWPSSVGKWKTGPGEWLAVSVFACFECYSRALSQSFLSCRCNLPVAVNHLNHQPELQPDDGDVHHHLRQDGCQSPGDYRDREGDTVRYTVSVC